MWLPHDEHWVAGLDSLFYIRKPREATVQSYEGEVKGTVQAQDVEDASSVGSPLKKAADMKWREALHDEELEGCGISKSFS